MEKVRRDREGGSILGGTTLEFHLPHQSIQTVIVSPLNHRTGHIWAFLLPFLFLGVHALHREEWPFKNVNQITSLPYWKTSESFPWLPEYNLWSFSWSHLVLPTSQTPSSPILLQSHGPLRSASKMLSWLLLQGFDTCSSLAFLYPSPSLASRSQPRFASWGGSPWPPDVMSLHPQHF